MLPFKLKQINSPGKNSLLKKRNNLNGSEDARNLQKLYLGPNHYTTKTYRKIMLYHVNIQCFTKFIIGRKLLNLNILANYEEHFIKIR